MQLIFVGGIHGSGKTTFCRTLAPALEARHESAGELIRTEAGRVETSDKAVVDVSSNQALLLRALRRLAANTPRLILDGHYTVVNGTGEFERVSFAVFRAINPVMLLCLSASPSHVVARLVARDGRSYGEAFLAEHNRAERRAAELVSSELTCPLFVVEDARDATAVVKLEVTIQSILETRRENFT